MTPTPDDPALHAWFENEATEGSKWSDLPDTSRVWLYTADRCLTVKECEALDASAEAFVKQWVAHGKALQASWRLEGRRCLVVALDATGPAATGCSIDAQVHWLKGLGEELGVDWMGRNSVIHYNRCVGRWSETGLAAFWMARKAGNVGEDAPLVNAVIASKADCTPSLVRPFSESWHEEMWR